MMRQQNISITSTLHMAEKELAAFVSAVRELFGSTEAQQSAGDWIEIVTLMSCQTPGASPDWRRGTMTAAGRLTRRVNSRTLAARAHGTPNDHFELSSSCPYKTITRYLARRV